MCDCIYIRFACAAELKTMGRGWTIRRIAPSGPRGPGQSGSDGSFIILLLGKERGFSSLKILFCCVHSEKISQHFFVAENMQNLRLLRGIIRGSNPSNSVCSLAYPKVPDYSF